MREQLQKWFDANHTDDKMLWKKASENQIMFVRDRLSWLVVGKSSKNANEVYVISEHTSKSIQLPVYSLTYEEKGLHIILRDNFYNWKMSVNCSVPIELDFNGLFHTSPPIDPDYTGDPLSSVYFEGFKDEWIYGYYDESDKKTWSAQISDEYVLWTVLFMIMRYLGRIKPFEWSIRNN